MSLVVGGMGLEKVGSWGIHKSQALVVSTLMGGWELLEC